VSTFNCHDDESLDDDVYRYYAICHPLRPRHISTTTRAVMTVSVIWFTSLLLVSPQLVFQRLDQLLVMRHDEQPPIRIAQVHTCTLRINATGLQFLSAVCLLIDVAAGRQQRRGHGHWPLRPYHFLWPSTSFVIPLFALRVGFCLKTNSNSCSTELYLDHSSVYTFMKSTTVERMYKVQLYFA